jgi:hypothetical protein
MKKIFALCGTLVAVALLGTACSHSNNRYGMAAGDNTSVPRYGTTADPITTEHMAPARSPRVAENTSENSAARDRADDTINNHAAAPTVDNTAPSSDSNRSTTEPTASTNDANLGASSSGRGR